MSAVSEFPHELAEFEKLLLDAIGHRQVPAEIERAIALAESLVARFPHSAEAHHMLGLAWYDFPSSASVRSWRCRMALEKAVLIEPDHQYAIQYLAYLAFDQERYGDALALQARLRHSYFIERDQEWRALKNAETRLVCRIRLNPAEFPSEDFAEFRRWYFDARNRENRDFSSGSFVLPQELRECAEWLFETGVSLEEPRLRTILTFVADADYAETFRSPLLKLAASKSTAEG